MGASVVATIALALFALAPLSQAKTVVGGFGTRNVANGIGLGGQFIQQSDIAIAVNSSGAGAPQGTVYATDSNRIERFSPSGVFERAWGENVIATSHNELQELVVDAIGGSYTLSFKGQTTDPIPYDATHGDMTFALGQLSTIGAGNLEVFYGSTICDAAGCPFRFIGALNATNLPQVTVDASKLEGSATMRTLVDGASAAEIGGASTGFEICVVAGHCQDAPFESFPTIANGGQLRDLRGVAVNQANGHVYVTEAGNRRVSEFDADGNFIRTWGWDVVAPFDEVQTVTVNAGAGDYKLTFNGQSTEDLPYDLPASGGVGPTDSVENALNALSSVTPGEVSVSGGPGAPGGGTYTVTFVTGAGIDATDVPELSFTAGTTGLSGGSGSGADTVSITTTVQGGGASTGFEICTAAEVCEQGVSGANGGQFGTTIGSPVTDAANNVWVPDPANRRIQVFDPTGNFIAAYGYNVDALGGGGALESCTSTALGACQAGTAGSGAGQFSASYPRELAFDSAANVYAVDAGNKRVQRFDPTLASATDFAKATFDSHTTTWGNGFSSFVHVAAAQGGTRLLFSLEKNVTPPNERQIIEVDPADGSVKDTSLVGVGLDDIQALAPDGASGKVYVTTGSLKASVPSRVLVLGAAPPAIGLALKTVQVKTDSAATLEGSIDLNGAWVGDCRFQYSTDQQSWIDVPVPDCKSFASNAEPQTVTANVAGLDPATKYFYRLQASRPLVPGSTVTTVAQVFETSSTAPIIAEIGAVQVADSSARLVATIDPRNSTTGYVFEYGTTPALGSSTAPLNIGGGTTPITVSQIVGGLSNDTTYYFRAVATNLIGSTISSSITFHTHTEPPPNLSNRAYEQVTPVDKNYGDTDLVILIVDKAVAAANGEGVAFCTANQFGEPTGRMMGLCSPYVTRRTQSGWRLLTDRYPEFCHVDSVSGNSEGALTVFPSPDYSRLLFMKSEFEGCPIPPLDPAAPLIPDGASFNYYLQRPLAEPIGYDLLNSQTEGAGAISEFAGGSDDFSHVVYHSQVNQTLPPDSPEPGSFQKLYEWTEGGLRLVSRDPNDDPFETNSGIPSIGNVNGYPAVNLASAVSADGERIFFANPDGISGCTIAGCQLYMREGGATTHDVSASECTSECGTPQSKADFFLSATPSGDKAFFTSCAKLTDVSASQGCTGASAWTAAGAEPGSKLYRWDLNAPPGHHLIDLTVDQEPSDGTQSGFYGLIGNSEDGDTAYFVTRNQILSGEPTFPVEGGSFGTTIRNAKLYRWNWNGGSPTTEYIGPYQGLLPGTTSGNLEYNISQQRRQVSADGKYVTIYTEARVDPAADADADADVYRWGEEEGWICASCQLPGAPSSGDIDLSELLLRVATDFEAISGIEPAIQMSEDGKRIFFGTPDALVPEDVNGEVSCPLNNDILLRMKVRIYACEDIYEWHDGTVSLLSSGTGAAPARLIGASASGRDIFFYTRERLVGWDQDNNVDIYNARIGGGFPEPPPQPPSCEGEGCRGTGTSAPPATGAGTAAFQGPGNPKAESPKGCPKGKRQVRRKGKVRCVAKQGKRRNGRAQRRAANHNRRTGR